MKQIIRFAKKALVVCVILVVAVAFEGCGEVADQTLEELKGIPSQLFATSETAEPGTAESAEPDYDYIYYRHNNQWVIARARKVRDCRWWSEHQVRGRRHYERRQRLLYQHGERDADT